MNYLVTGGAGFIGRWVVKELLTRDQARIVVLDNFSNSTPRNLAEFAEAHNLRIETGDVSDRETLDRIWAEHGPFDVVWHLAARIRVQDSIDDPMATFRSDVAGTMEVLERCRKQYYKTNGIDPSRPFHLAAVEPKLTDRRPRFVFMSTCMVYSRANGSGICEAHPTNPSSPYGAAKIAAENLVLSYHKTYRLPTKVIRPFNTYGAFQKRNMEGGVVAIFVARDLAQETLHIKGDGTQTRDLLYVEDCARFVVQAGLNDAGDGEIVNAGLGRDIPIKELARLVTNPVNGGNGTDIHHVEHDHPQAEIAKLLCDNSKAAQLFGWTPQIDLEEGIGRTRAWITDNADAL